MIKKLIKRIEWELKQAEDYMEQAVIIKDEDMAIHELFLSLAKDEIVHAEKLMKAGDDYLQYNERSDYEEREHDAKAEERKEWCAVWKWIKRQSNERINDLYVIKNKLGGR